MSIFFTHSFQATSPGNPVTKDSRIERMKSNTERRRKTEEDTKNKRGNHETRKRAKNDFEKRRQKGIERIGKVKCRRNNKNGEEKKFFFSMWGTCKRTQRNGKEMLKQTNDQIYKKNTIETRKPKQNKRGESEE